MAFGILQYCNFKKRARTHTHKRYWTTQILLETLHLQVTSMKLFWFSNNLNCYSPVTVQYHAQSTLSVYIDTTFYINSYLCCKQSHLHPHLNGRSQNKKNPHILPIDPFISKQTSLGALSSDQICNYNLHKMFLKNRTTKIQDYNSYV